jgi:hypothetical protein
MFNTFCKINLLISIIVLTSYCKKNAISESEKKPIGEIFFYQDEVPMFEKPEASLVLKKFKKTDLVQILETKILDPKNPQSMYYKVYHEDKFGYIPIIFEIKKSMFAFLYTNSKGKIKASSLRIRENPDLNGKVITSVPKGEVVDILWEGQLFEIIDFKYDTWMKIKTKDGKAGFSYAGYITKNLEEDENSFSFNSSALEGFVEIKESPIYYSKLNVEVKSDDPSPCGYTNLASFPKSGEIVRTLEISIMNGEKYYQVEGSNDDHGCYGGYRGWISEKQVTFIEDIFKYTSENYGSEFDKVFLEEINKYYNGKLNVRYLNIEELNINVKEKYPFYKMNGNTIYYKKNKQYYLAGNLNDGSIEDINKDGVDEIVSKASYECMCMCSGPPAFIKIWNGNEFKEVYNNSGIVNLDFKDKIIIESLTQYDGDPYSSDPNRKPKITTNYYEIKNNEMIPTKKRPKS